MDWYLRPDTAAASQLRAEVCDYLTRHAIAGADIHGAELAFSELLTNAVESSSGQPVWVSLDWGTPNPVVTIHDLGPGFELDPPSEVGPEATRGRGLMIASHLTLEFGVAAKRAGGSRVSAVLDVERRPSDDHDYQTSSPGRLPTPSEARDGMFPREPFLRALVVELAETVDRERGPAFAEAAIAEVGAKVGSRMEASYRSERGDDQPFDNDQIAEFLIGLKRAIGGDFYVVSVDDEKIVLGNRRCPFGEAVKLAPSLCRMTSSVFGGIGARNMNGEVAVQLEERIAVGDPECRVVIWLRPPPSEAEVFVHRYRPPASGDAHHERSVR